MARKDSEHQKKSMSLMFRGYSFISTLAEDNKLSVRSLEVLDQFGTFSIFSHMGFEICAII